MTTIRVTREQVAASGLDPDKPLKMLMGRSVSTVELEDGLVRDGASTRTVTLPENDSMVAPRSALLYQFNNLSRLVVTADDPE